MGNLSLVIPRGGSMEAEHEIRIEEIMGGNDMSQGFQMLQIRF